jgi:hypothetical protein
MGRILRRAIQIQQNTPRFQETQESNAKSKPQHPYAFVNDPSAGSPTETLLRLLRPLNDQV